MCSIRKWSNQYALVGINYPSKYNHIIQMEASLANQLKPRRSNTVIQGASKASFYSNIYEIKLNRKEVATIYQYSIDLEPQLPKDSSKVMEGIINSIYHQLKKSIGLLCWKGEMLWGRKEAKIAIVLKSQFSKRDEKYKFDVLVKPVKEISLQNFVQENPDKQSAVCQILNINIKNQLKEIKMVEMSPGKYYHIDELSNNSSGAGLSVWRGFKVSALVLNDRLFLQIDACSRILREQNFLNTLERERKEMSLQDISNKYKGTSILMKYGNLKIYKIQEIDFKQTPSSKFFLKKEQLQISYADYFKKRYQLVVKNLKQPLVKVLTQKDKINNKESVQQYAYLIPEFLALTGLTDRQRQDHKVMQSLDQYTKLTAQKRMQEGHNVLKKLKNQNDLMFQIKDQPECLPGFKINDPEIGLGSNKKAFIKNGTINLREKVMDPAKIVNYMFCYSIGNSFKNDPKIDQEDADIAIQYLTNASKTFGIGLYEPYFVQIKGRNVNDWKNKIAQQYQNMITQDQKKSQEQNKPQIIIVFINQFEEKFYAQLKREITNKYNCPSQFIRKRTLSAKQKGVMSCASKIILQMNVKLGHSLWVVPNNHPYLRNRRIAIAGMANSKGKTGVNVSLVGTVSNDLTNIFCDCKQIKSKENNSIMLYQGIFTQWFQNYFKNNKKSLPETIVIYREGLNDVQFKQQLEIQLEALMETLRIVPQKAKIQMYNPHVLYILANKKVNTRIFSGDGNNKTLKFNNPDSGSVIFEGLAKKDQKEFFLASVSVGEKQGTCTPVQFKVAHENADIPLDAIAELTYNQCFNYFNWTGPVRVPGVLQYANKLGKQFSQHIGDELITKEKNSDLKSKPFFL